MEFVEVDAGIADSGVAREEIFLVTKLQRGSLDRDSVGRETAYHPGLPQDELLDAARQRDILITAYSPLDTGGLVGQDVLAEVGDHYGKSAEQVAIRWLLDQPLVATIPRSSDLQHRQANLDVFDFSLTQDERDRIAQLGR